MDSIFRGNLKTARGRALAWLDSLLVDHAVLRLAWTNFAPVIPGRLYRCNHPTPGRLAALTSRYGLKTLINLRGAGGGGSDALSREMAVRLGLDFVDAPLKSRGAPPRARLLHLTDVFLRMREPALIHCKSGADRAGLAAAVFLLMNGVPVTQARRQLALRFGHLTGSDAGVLTAFLLAYAREAEGRKPLLDWLRDDYDPATLDREFRAGSLSRWLNNRLLARE